MNASSIAALGYGFGAAAIAGIGFIGQAVQEVITGGGGSATVYKIKPKFRKKQYHFLDEDIVEVYEELSKNPETKVEAKKIVKPYVKNQEIDYVRLIENVDKIERLLALYKELKQIEEDDEILMLMYG